MAIENGFVETNVRNGNGVFWINPSGKTRVAPQTFKPPIITGRSSDHDGFINIFLHEGSPIGDYALTAVGLTATALGSLMELYPTLTSLFNT